MENKPHIPILLGTAREGRQSAKVARYIVSVLESREDVTTELVDVRDHLHEAITVPPWVPGGADDKGSAWKGIVEKSNALLIVSPEYNHGYPGELKILLDSLWEHYKGLPVVMAGVSNGRFGGARLIDHIKPVLVEMHFTPLREALSFPNVKDTFNDDGSIKDEKTTEFVNKVIDVLVKKAR